MNILVSACLLGLPTRYDGAEKSTGWVARLAARHTLIPVCPEQLGGLPTPRTPCERQGTQVVARDGRDCTVPYHRGAACALSVARLNRCAVAILKQRSPSCGTSAVYDGAFTGTVIPGQGVAASLLAERGLTLFSEEDEAACLAWLAQTTRE